MHSGYLKGQGSYFKEQFSLCGSKSKKFWKMVKDLENKPSLLKVDDVVVTDKKHMSELFNHHFIKSGLFDLQQTLKLESFISISSSKTQSWTLTNCGCFA